MDDFSQPGRRNAFNFTPSPSNFIAPRKRPLSSITPLIAEHLANNTLFFATGAAGGSRIISATTQVAWHVLAQNMTMRDAVAERRVHHQLMPDVLYMEEGCDKGVVEDLEEKGHSVEWIGKRGNSAVQGVMRGWEGEFEAVGETRQVNSGGYSV
jgi:gamma-glutamyltranspeptidase/glutathione hydrolase